MKKKKGKENPKPSPSDGPTRPPPPPMPTAAAAPAPVRLRLLFDNRRLLRKAQRDDGLRRCWLLLPPELATVADLAAHVAVRFRLGRSCPLGIVLSMDGFVLPPFESTCILRDKDVVRVKQKSCKKIVGHNDMHCLQDREIAETRLLPIDDKILAINYPENGSKHQEEQGDHQAEENATVSRNRENINTSSKRKCHDGVAGLPETSKKKKVKLTNSGKHIDCSKGDNVQLYQDQSKSKKLMSSDIDIEAKRPTLQPETTATLEQQKKTERNNQTELKCEAKREEYNAQSDTKKLESRSARRKKLKRQLRKKEKEQMEKNVHEDSPIAAGCSSSSNHDGLPGASSNQGGLSGPSSNQDGLPGPSSNQNGLHVPFSSHKADEEESDTSDEIVPVVVRPGHIRFELAGNLRRTLVLGGEPNNSPAKEIQGTFQWSGTMSKKKGQKWGMNNSNKRNADIGYDVRITGSSTEVNHHVVDSKITENGLCGVSNQKADEGSNIESSSVKTIAEGEKSSVEPLDFESLYLLMRLPKEGDLIAYRLVELSSSLCPELSSYRVGKVLIYDPISLRIILLPVPEYPIISEENERDDDSDMLMDLSPYKEDGSLEIEYSSLLDVRLLKANESEPVAVNGPFAQTSEKAGSLAVKPVTLEKNGSNIESQKPPMVSNNNKYREVTPKKSTNTVWEKIGEPPNDKHDVQENGWETWKPNASTSAWSYRALRSSALGPTMAMLRGKNSQQGKPSNRMWGE